MRLPAAIGLGLCLVIAFTPEAAALGTPTYTCEATAPETTSCTTGEHTMLFGAYPSVVAVDDYSGTIVSRIQGGMGARGQMCSFESGVPTGCIDWGSGFLIPGTTVTHTCGSYDDAGATIPGGRGVFGCSVSGVL